MGVRTGGDRCANLTLSDTVLIITEKHKEKTTKPGCVLNNGKLATADAPKEGNVYCGFKPNGRWVNSYEIYFIFTYDEAKNRPDVKSPINLAHRGHVYWLRAKKSITDADGATNVLYVPVLPSDFNINEPMRLRVAKKSQKYSQ